MGPAFQKVCQTIRELGKRARSDFAIREPTSLASLHCQDLSRIRFLAPHGMRAFDFPKDQHAFHVASMLRQNLLFAWATLPSDSLACINMAIAPTLVYGMLAVESRLEYC